VIARYKRKEDGNRKNRRNKLSMPLKSIEKFAECETKTQI
jgi:hypothetical protein